MPGGGWSSAKLSTSEASVWLCEVLKKYSLNPALDNVGAHSLKATALSWLAKFMAPEKIRRLMGYHVKPKDKTVLIFSRDALAAGLQVLTNIITSIHDREPKERWQMHEVPTPDKSSYRLVEADQSSSDEVESVEEGAESEDERNIEAVMNSRLGPPKKSVSDLFRHGVTGTIHHGCAVEGRLARGRPISGVMIKLEEDIHALGNRCKVCEGYPGDKYWDKWSAEKSEAVCARASSNGFS